MDTVLGNQAELDDIYGRLQSIIDTGDAGAILTALSTKVKADGTESVTPTQARSQLASELAKMGESGSAVQEATTAKQVDQIMQSTLVVPEQLKDIAANKKFELRDESTKSYVQVRDNINIANRDRLEELEALIDDLDISNALKKSLRRAVATRDEDLAREGL